MRYLTNAALIVKGDRVGRGVEIELTPDEAAVFGTDISPVEPAQPVEPAPELSSIPLDEMSMAQLKERAKELGLSASGSKADLLERITLHLSKES
jgi:hypothetical protein